MTQKQRIRYIVEYARNRNLFRNIRRATYPDYDIGEELQLITALGKSACAKFRIDEENRFAYENLVRWARADKKMESLDPETHDVRRGDVCRGVYLAGGTGTGKSWCMRIMLAYCRTGHFAIQFGLDDPTQVTWVDARADAVCQSYADSGMIGKYMKCNILCLQDVGAEPIETLYMGNRLNVIRQILEYRGDRSDCITLITSNIPISHSLITERYGARVASRLIEMCNYMEIRGIDRRKL